MKLEPIIERMKELPIDGRGYPVPWFVAWIDGIPEFRATDSEKFFLALKKELCWVCGNKLGSFKTFVIGPMCGINRNTAEPPCHLDCAEWSARNCPFLSNPDMVRNEKNLEGENPGGIFIKRNPGVTLLWTTKKFFPYKVHNGYLIKLGEPVVIKFYFKGRIATKEEIHQAIEAGCPFIEKIAKEEGQEALFYKAKEEFLNLINDKVICAGL